MVFVGCLNSTRWVSALGVIPSAQHISYNYVSPWQQSKDSWFSVGYFKCNLLICIIILSRHAPFQNVGKTSCTLYISSVAITNSFELVQDDEKCNHRTVYRCKFSLNPIFRPICPYYQWSSYYVPRTVLPGGRYEGPQQMLLWNLCQEEEFRKRKKLATKTGSTWSVLPT